MGELPTARDYVNVHRVDAVCPHCDRWHEFGLGGDCRGGVRWCAADQIAVAMQRVRPAGASDQSQRPVLRIGRVAWIAGTRHHDRPRAFFQAAAKPGATS